MITTDEIYRKASSIFADHNKGRGLPYGFDHLKPKQQQPWLDAARKMLKDTI